VTLVLRLVQPRHDYSVVAMHPLLDSLPAPLPQVSNESSAGEAQGRAYFYLGKGVRDAPSTAMD